MSTTFLEIMLKVVSEIEILCVLTSHDIEWEPTKNGRWSLNLQIITLTSVQLS